MSTDLLAAAEAWRLSLANDILVVVNHELAKKKPKAVVTGLWSEQFSMLTGVKWMLTLKMGTKQRKVECTVVYTRGHQVSDTIKGLWEAVQREAESMGWGRPTFRIGTREPKRLQ